MSTMKHCLDWYDLLPEPARSQAKRNYVKGWCRYNEMQPSLSDAITSGWYWRDSPEGLGYWTGIHDRVLKGEFDAPQQPNDDDLLKEGMACECGPEMREAIYQMAVDGGFPTNDSGHHQRHGNGMQYSSYSHAIDWWGVNRTLTIIPLHEFIRRLANTIEHRKKQEAEKPKELTLEKAKELLGRCLTMNPQAWQRLTDELSEYGIKSSKPCSE